MTSAEPPQPPGEKGTDVTAACRTTSAAGPFLTAAEAATILRTGVWTVVKLCRDGDLPATKPGKAWLIRPADLDAYLDAHSNQTEREAS